MLTLTFYKLTETEPKFDPFTSDNFRDFGLCRHFGKKENIRFMLGALFQRWEKEGFTREVGRARSTTYNREIRKWQWNHEAVLAYLKNYH
jgi:hypothetical protein